MDKSLQRILDIEKGNRFLAYIVARVTRDDYRGIHKSQHNRYDIDKLGKILDAIREVAGENNFSVPSGDIGRRRGKLNEMSNQHPKFNKIYQILKSEGVLRAPDPLRKNFFVEFSRAGFLEKYDKEYNKLDPFRRTHTETIKLSAEGIRFLNESSPFQKRKIFTEGLDRLLRNALEDLVEAIDLSDYRKDKFSFEEYTLIFSDDRLDSTEKIEILGAWRSLMKNQQDNALRLIKKYCSPKRFSGNKTDQRDYHNWRNETQQLMSLFKMTVYFQVLGNQFSLNTGKEFGMFDIKRQEAPKMKYFESHEISKKKNYQLHHIIPLSYIRNQEEYKLIDNFQNLIYLHKEKHKEIKRDYIVFIPKDPKIHFGNRFQHSDVVTAKQGVDTNFRSSLLSRMEKYNKKLRKSLLDSKPIKK